MAFSLNSLSDYIVAAAVVYISLKLLYKLITNLTIFLFSKSVNFKKYGDWAVVTGCTDGIGKEYAQYLAKSGLNVVLISRNIEKLNELSQSLKSDFKIDTKVIAADFTEENKIYDEIRKELNGLNIGVLINNVGVAEKCADYFHVLAADEKYINDMVHCNIISMTKMTAIVLPGMADRKKGIIVNLSSGMGIYPMPFNTIYSSTKAYVDYFSKCLQLDYESRGIFVQSLCPFYVSTKMTRLRPSLFAPSAKDYVKSAVKTIGRQSFSNGCLMHNLQAWAINTLLPTWLFKSITRKQFENLRRLQLKKLNAKKDK